MNTNTETVSPETIKKYICRWAFLKMSDFNDLTPIKSLRPDFGEVSILGMLTDCMFPQKCPLDIDGLDTVDDFMKWFKKHGIQNINEFKNP